MKDYSVIGIKKEETHEWLLHKHYARRMPPISFAFGLYKDKVLVGVMTYGKPPSSPLCDGVCGKENSRLVYELNRVCLHDNLERNVASYFMAKTFALLPKPLILVSYSDTSVGHIGYIYQATNWIYTGLSDKRTEWREKGSNQHSKTICEKYTLQHRVDNPDIFEVVDRPRKHRYIFFLGNKRDRASMKKALNYSVMPYPKGDSLKYDASYNPSTQGVLF